MPMLQRVRNLLKNRMTRSGSIIFISESSSSLVMMIVGFLIARLCAVADFGKFNTALAYATIVAIIVDSGMGMLAAKDIARGTPTSLSQLDQIFSWRLSVIALSCIAGPLIGWALLPSASMRWLAVCLIPASMLLNMNDFFCWVFKGAMRAELCAILQVGSRVMLLALCLIALFSRRQLPLLAAAYGATGLVMSVAGFVIVSRTVHPLRVARLSKTFFSTTLKEIYKLGAILILSVAFSRIDIMLVARLKSEADAGLFSASARIIDGVRLIPMVAYSVYLPIFSALHQQIDALRSTFRIAFDTLVAIGVTIALVASAFAQPLLTHVLGNAYGPAAACFRPMAWSALLLCTNILMFALLYALNDHRTPLIGISTAIVLEVILDLILIPRYGITAAGWIRIIADSANAAIMIAGLMRTRVLTLSMLVLRPALLVGCSVVLLMLLKRQSAVLRLLVPWSLCMILMISLRFSKGQTDAEEVAVG